MIVEIVGSAGAGKTTLSDLLRKQIPALWYISDWRPVSSPSDVLFGAASLFPLLWPSLLPSTTRRFTQPFTRRELTWMLRLLTSQRTLARLAPGLPAGRHVLLDQGPIYTLMRLAEQTSGREVDAQQAVLWQQQMLNRWSHLLDVVIWLDAPDALLVERVFSRTKAHWLQRGTEEAAKAVLQEHRRLYQQLLGQLEETGRCRVLCYDTGAQQPAALAAQICADL